MYDTGSTTEYDTSSMTNPDVYRGLRKDPLTGDYRVDSGYSYQANRYKIDESYLDEDDNLWIKADAVERHGEELGADNRQD